MKRIYAILVMAFLVLSAFAFADNDGAGSDADETAADDVSGSDNESDDVSGDDSDNVITPAPVRQRLAEHKEQVVADIAAARERQIAKFQDMKQEQADKFRNLRADQIEKFQELRQEQVEKYTALRQEQLEKFRDMRQEQLEKFANLTADEFGKIAALDRARIKEFANMTSKAVQARLKNIQVKVVKAADLYRKRVVAKDRLEQARNNYKNAEDRYLKAKQNFLDAKDAFERWKDVDDNRSVEAAKQFLTHAGEMIVSDLEKIKAKAQENDDLAEDEVNSIVSDADARIAEIQSAMEKVDASSTKEEVKEAGALIVEAWNRVRARINLHVGTMVAAKVGEIIQRSEQLEAKLDRILSDMGSRGIEVEDIDAKVDSFSENVDLARQKFNEARSLLKEVNDERLAEGRVTDELKDKAKKAHELSKEANDALKEAHSILMDILKDIRQKGGNLDVPDEEEVTVVEEVQDSTETA